MSQTTTNAKNNMALANLHNTVSGKVIQPFTNFGNTFTNRVNTANDFITDKVLVSLRTASRSFSSAIFCWIILSLAITLVVHFEPSFATEHPLIYDFANLGIDVFEVSLEFGKECLNDVVNYFKDITLMKVLALPFLLGYELIKNFSVFVKLF